MFLEFQGIFLKPAVMLDHAMVSINLTLIFHVLDPALMSAIHGYKSFKILVNSELKVKLQKIEHIKIKNLSSAKCCHKHRTVYWLQKWLVLFLVLRIKFSIFPEQNFSDVAE